MKAHVLRRRVPIAPFDRDASALPFLCGTLEEQRATLLRQVRASDIVDVGADTVVDGPALVIADDVYVSRRALRGFLAQARMATGPVRLCLPDSRFMELFGPLQDLPTDDDGRFGFEIAYVPVGSQCTAAEALATDAWVEAPFREIPFAARIPHYIMGTESADWMLPLTSTAAMRIRHWVHLVRAGTLLPQVMLLDHVTFHPLRTLAKLMLSLRGNRTATLEALKGRLVTTGKNTFIHPAATVEASFIGDNVYVGPHALVRQSVIGDGSYIEERAHVAQSTLGPRTMVSKNSVLSACVVFGDTDACTRGMQLCLIAERCGITSFAYALDTNPGRGVRVRDGDQLRDVGELSVGACFCEEVFAGAGVMVAAGRVVPKGVRLVGQPDTFFQSFDHAAPGLTGTAVNGRFTPLTTGPKTATTTTTTSSTSGSAPSSAKAG